MVALAVAGLGVATYLTIVHYVGFSILACVGAHGGHSSCQTVQTSEWSKLAGIPVALLGLIGYVLILGTLLLPDSEQTRLGTLGLTLFGVAFSGYLTYRELYSINAICEWCVSSACIMTLLLIGAIRRYLVGGPPPATVEPALGGSPADTDPPEPVAHELSRPRT